MINFFKNIILLWELLNVKEKLYKSEHLHNATTQQANLVSIIFPCIIIDVKLKKYIYIPKNVSCVCVYTRIY